MIMGSLFSRRKPVPQNHQPTGCGPRHTAIAICNFPPGPAEQILQMGEQLHLLSQWLYDGISREKAEELLMMPSNRDGSFLIRKSQMRKGCYALSVRHAQHGGWDSVKHYRINCLENNWIYITCHLTFPHLQDLVDYYSDSQDGLCCRLQEPCFIQGSDSGLLPSLSKPVTVKQSNLNWQEINSSELLSENLLPEDSPISLGLRDAINSYVLVTEDLPLETRSTRKGKKCKDI
ncbi:src-like-adapter 2 isoform X2 [Sphaerodactylus townsendi]|nr:src-like-adapter 2 isoform X2 [Sphaerodactylus townsendi]